MLITPGWLYEDLRHGLRGFISMAYDGRFFFFTDGEIIYLYSNDLIPLNCIKLNEKITAFCYDNEEDCFWAADEKRGGIRKLNRRFEVTDTLEHPAPVHGLSYFCAHDSLLATGGNTLHELCKHGRQRAIRAVGKGANVFSAAPYLGVLRKEPASEIIRVYAPNGTMHSALQAPEGYAIRDVLFYHPENQILALALPAQKKPPIILRHAMPCIDICACNYRRNDFCPADDTCRWLIANDSCDSDWRLTLMQPIA